MGRKRYKGDPSRRDRGGSRIDGFSTPSRQSLQYPAAAKNGGKNGHLSHGVKVSDPYRLAGRTIAPRNGAMGEGRKTLTFSYLDKIRTRAQVMKRLEQLYNYPKYAQPFRRSKLYFFSKNDGLQNQKRVLRAGRPGWDNRQSFWIPTNFPLTVHPGCTRSRSPKTLSTARTLCQKPVGPTGKAHVMEVASERFLPMTWGLKFSTLWWPEGIFL